MADITEYIYKKMIERTDNYQWRMVEDSHKRALEIYIAITYEFDEDVYIQDINGEVNDSGVVHFEEVVCFYDKEASRILPENYLYAVPIDVKAGIEEGYIDAFLKQLNITFGKSYSKLRSFLKDDSQKEFQLAWNEQNLKNTVKTMQEIGRYSTNRLTLFQEDEDESIVDQFKEDTHDGLERI